MSLVGSVSLSNNQDGIYLGIVSIDNLNASANEILYTKDGATIKGNSNLTYDDTLSILNAPSVFSTDISATNMFTYSLDSNIINNTTNIITNTLIATDISGTNLKITNINGSSYPPASVTINNQATTRIPYETSTSNTLDSNANLTFNDSTNTLSAPNITVTNINGSAPVSVTAQANTRLITATATTNTLHANQDAIWDGLQLSLFNTNPLVVGRGNSATSDKTNTAIGVSALPSITTGTNNTVIGYSNQSITTTSNNTIIGSNNTFTAGSNQNTVLIGSNSKCGNASVSVGSSSFCGDASVSIGYTTGKSAMSGGYNVIIGNTCGNSLTSGNGNCLVGSNNSQSITTGLQNTIIGISSGAGSNAITTGSNNTICGYYSDTGVGTYSNVGVFGSNIRGIVSGSNQVQIGDSATTVYTYATATRSDARDKTDIQDSTLGLDFINQLKPRQFRWDYREDYKIDCIDENQNITTTILSKDGTKKRNRLHCGLIAQEVKSTMDNLGLDFAGYQDHKVNGGGDVLTINYNELISPLIKAVQELSAKVKALEAK